ncbi:hypothetical protein [Halovivax gelatinilyticus]|uniref:hypothetical protein n=1 Tax=Halovivax gelatinilyticus TaxID=2961597 RepID=UPI0020CA2C0F|nr:hypothetical protein [Halovivax gelatinilyticus]
MARERSELGDQPRVSATEHTGASTRNRRLLGRRRFVGLAGAATAAAAGLVGAGSASTDESYETITVGTGEHRVIRVGAGETLENVVIDVTGSGASATIDAHATNTTIRNVGFRGRMDNPPTAIMGVSDTGGGTSVVENVYLGDGASNGHRHGVGLWVSPQHSGHLVIDGVNIQEMGDNSFYCSAPGGRGTVELRNCYSANSWVSHYRLARGRVENCVALNDERHQDGRGIWAWSPGTVEVVDCDLEMNGRHYAIVAGANGDSGRVSVKDSRFDTGFHGGLRRAHGSTIDLASGNSNDPDGSRIPDGCPVSAEGAAAGIDSTASADTEHAPSLEHTLELAGQFRYRIEVDGEIRPSAEAVQWLDEDEAYGDGWAEWWLSGSDDAETTWEYDGEITAFSVEPYDEETAVESVRIDGTCVDPTTLPGYNSHTLELAGQFRYRIDVDGEIRPSEEAAQWLDEGEAYGDGWAEWWLSGSDDARTTWNVDGTVADVQVTDYDGAADVRYVRLDGEPFEY